MPKHEPKHLEDRAALPPLPDLRGKEHLAFPKEMALVLVDSVPKDRRELIWDQGEGHNTLVRIGDIQLVEKQFYDGNTVSPKAGPQFRQNRFRNGEGLNLVAAALNDRLAPLGITVVSPPFDEDDHRMVTPLIPAPDPDFLHSRLFAGWALPASAIRKTIVNDLVANHPEIHEGHVQAISRLVMRTADELGFHLKEADLILFDIRLGDSGIVTDHPELKLRATLVLMDLH